MDYSTSQAYYTSQHNTGSYSKFNCGLACVAMAVRYSKHKLIDIEETRANIRGWTILKPRVLGVQLSKNYVSYNYATPTSFEEFANLIKKPNTILIVNVNMKHIPKNNIINKPYRTISPWWGHYLVIDKLHTSDAEWCCVADPYDNQNPRIYNTFVLFQAMQRHNKSLFVIHKG